MKIRLHNDFVNEAAAAVILEMRLQQQVLEMANLSNISPSELAGASRVWHFLKWPKYISQQFV